MSPVRFGTAETHFWTKVDTSAGPADCWPWLAGKNSNGYGTFQAQVAHRVAYELEHGEIPQGAEIHHVCVTRDCVNPRHLKLIDHASHMEGHARSRTHCRRGHLLADTAVRNGLGPDGRQKVRCRICREIRRQALLRGRNWDKSRREETPTARIWLNHGTGATGLEPATSGVTGQRETPESAE